MIGAEEKMCLRLNLSGTAWTKSDCRRFNGGAVQESVSQRLLVVHEFHMGDLLTGAQRSEVFSEMHVINDVPCAVGPFEPILHVYSKL